MPSFCFGDDDLMRNGDQRVANDIAGICLDLSVVASERRNIPTRAFVPVSQQSQ